MSRYIRLKDVLDVTDGIFEELSSMTMPWGNDPTPLTLDLLYEGRSADKIISPLVKNRLDTNGKLTGGDKTLVALQIKAVFFDKWSHLWELMQIDYDPLSNYDMVEDGTDQTKRTGTDTNLKTGSEDNSGAITRTGSERDNGDTTRTGSESDSGTGANNAENRSIYGFNSNSAVPADTSTTSHDNTHTYTNVKDAVDTTHTYNNVADTDSRKKTYNNVTDALTHNTTDDMKHHLTRSGNIGVTTSQQMAESEIQLRSWLFFENVMKDVDSLLTLAIY